MVNSAVANSIRLVPQDVGQNTSPFKMYSESDTTLPPHAIFARVVKIPDSNVRVRRDFFVRIEPEGNWYYAISPISLIYEVGDTRKEALRNYLDALVDHFEWLTDEEAVLAPTVQMELTLLRRYLQA